MAGAKAQRAPVCGRPSPRGTLLSPGHPLGGRQSGRRRPPSLAPGLRLRLLEFLLGVLEIIRVEIETRLLLDPSLADVGVRPHGVLKGERLPELARLGFQGPGAVDVEFLDHFL